MADAVARREARRKRILENSENRLKRITGTYEKDPSEEKFTNSATYTKLKTENDLVSANDVLMADSKAILEEKHINFSKQDNVAEIQEFELNLQNQEPDKDFIPNYLDAQCLTKDEERNCDISSFSPITGLSEQAFVQESQHTLLNSLCFSPFTCILLAAFINLLLLLGVDFSIYKGIIVPYVLIALTRLCLQNKSEDSYSSSMLVAALILCNIKPEIVHKLKRLITLFTLLSRDFALYLTSFVLSNWIISTFWTELSSLTFS